MALGGPGIGRARWVGPLVAVIVLASCGDAPATPSRETSLPPLPTVTTTLAPTTTRVPFYDVQPGDTLDSIAAKLGVLVADLVAANAIVDPDRIEAGQRLAVPQPPPAPATTVAP